MAWNKSERKVSKVSINHVVLSGNIGRQPDVRVTPTGTNILTFSLAVNERVKKGDAWEDYTNWVDIVVFGKRAESLSKILEKGMKVTVSGKLRYSSWEREQGKRSKIEVIAEDVDIMQRKGDQRQVGYQQQNGGQQSYQQNNYQQQQPQTSYQQQPQDDYYQSDIPF